MSTFTARQHALHSAGNDNVVPAERLAAASALAGAERGTLPVNLENLDIRLEKETGILWAHFRHSERPCYSMGLLNDIARLQVRLREIDLEKAGIRYLAWASSSSAAWCLGGDLAHFAETIRRGDRNALLAYAHRCIDVLHANYVSLNQPLTTVAVVNGDALGGGFEALLTDDLVIAERGIRLGLPEILFNMFPGMGAYSFLSRKLGSALAKRLILSGELYTAEEMHDLGIVDILAEPGTGEDVLRQYTKRHQRRFQTESALRAVDHRCQPVSREELLEVTELWVDRALSLEPLDLRKMERLAASQSRLRQAEAVC